MMRTVLTLVAALAILHMIALAVGTGYLAAKGRLNRDSINAIAEILLADEGSDSDQGTDEVQEASEAARSEEAILREQHREEMEQRSLVRKRSELAQKQVAVLLLMQKQMEDQEKLRRERRQFESERKARAQKAHDESFQKMLKVLEMMKADKAKTVLFEGFSSDEAARMLLRMNPRQGMKTIEAALDDPVLKPKALQVFKMIQDTAPPDSDWSKVTTPSQAEPQ